MAAFRDQLLAQPPVHFPTATHIRRSSIASVTSGRRSDVGEEFHHRQSSGQQQQQDLEAAIKGFEVEEGPGLAGVPEKAGPYDCISNPAPWWHQITMRALLIGAVLGAVFSIIIHKLSLTTGIIPSLNIAAGLLGFIFIKGWVAGLKLLRIEPHEFTPQENTVVQTCITACSSLAFAGGFGCYLIGMDRQTYENLGDIAGNRPQDVYQPEIQRSIPYLLCIGIIGVFTLVILRKRFIIDYRLQFPSGTATGVLISSFHTPKGEAVAREQVKTLGYWGITSFLFSFFKWFFSSSSGPNNCGFDSWPTFGLNALNWRWNFDFEQTYIGVGMIVPYVVSYSMMWGSIISWGIMWPLLSRKEGDWYAAGYQDGDFRGLSGYKNFIAIAVFIADGIYNFIKIGILSLQVYIDERREQKRIREEGDRRHQMGSVMARAGGASSSGPGRGCCHVGGDMPSLGRQSLAGDRTLVHARPGPRVVTLQDVSDMEREEARIKELRDCVFLKGQIPWWIAAIGYTFFGILAIIVIPLLYPPAKWYFLLVLVLITPLFAVANTYGAGLTDFDMSSIYGTVCMFAFAQWAGGANGGVIAGLAVSGLVMASTSSAATLMQDFKTGHITMSSPRSMFLSQLAGALMGCFIAPLTFQMYWKSFSIGSPTSDYKAPYANIYRGMAVLGTQGFEALPEHCLQFMIGFFVAAFLLNIIRDLLPSKYSVAIPVPMAMAIPFFIGANVAIDIAIGAVVKAFWHWTSPATAEGKVPAAASGLIAGDGIWSIPSAILAIAKVNPPLCMSFSQA